MRNLFVSMLIIGLWHGAGWTFIIWGGLHGLLLMINHGWRRFNINLPKVLNWSMTFLCAVLCWVFFRAASVSDAMSLLNSMLDFRHFTMTTHERQHLTVLLAAVGALAIVPNPLIVMNRFKENYFWLLVTVTLMIYTLCQFSQISDFLYFQF